jgi:hypothetical protein
MKKVSLQRLCQQLTKLLAIQATTADMQRHAAFGPVNPLSTAHHQAVVQHGTASIQLLAALKADCSNLLMGHTINEGSSSAMPASRMLVMVCIKVAPAAFILATVIPLLDGVSSELLLLPPLLLLLLLLLAPMTPSSGA